MSVIELQEKVQFAKDHGTELEIVRAKIDLEMKFVEILLPRAIMHGDELGYVKQFSTMKSLVKIYYSKPFDDDKDTLSFLEMKSCELTEFCDNLCLRYDENTDY